MPIALAILLSFFLSPVVVRLRRLGWSKTPAVIAVALGAFLIIVLFGGVLAFQLTDLTQALPRYKENVQAKLRTITSSSRGKVRQVMDAIDVARLDTLPEGATNGPSGARVGKTPAEKPIPVEMHEPATTPMKVVQSVLGNLLNPLLTAAIVVVFVLLMLVAREDLRNRLLRLLGSSRLNISTQALDETAHRVSRYLLMQLLVNTGYGILVGLGLYLIGVPDALGWGILATLLRFIPYLGPIFSAVLPISLAVAVDPGWTKPILTLALFVVIEPLISHLVEPWLYGSTAGISPFAVIVAALFWTWLWGPVGLLLATPMTVCLAVLGRYVPQLEFLHIVLSDERALPIEARFYQRLLANDEDEAAEVAEEALKSHSPDFLYDTVMIPALSLAANDRNQGSLDASRFKYILDTTRQIVDELDLAAAGTDEPKTNASPESRVSVLCIPAKDEADEICGTMLVRLLRANNIPARSVSASLLANERLQQVRRSGVSIVCVSALPPSALRQARLFCKRLRSEFPDLRIMVGVWTATPDLPHIHSRLPAALVNQVATSLPEAVRILQALAANEPAVHDTSIAAEREQDLAASQH
jgi:predicted PurR-regulated permease PerM